jgi:hypothetical protein
MTFSGFIKARERPRQTGGGHEKNETKGKKTERTPGINRGKPEDEQKQEQGTDTKWTYRTQGVNDTHRRQKGGRANTGEQKIKK